MPPLVPARDVDLSSLIRAGDVVTFGQGMAEPRSLTRRLVEARRDVGPFTCVIGALSSDTFTASNSDGIDFLSYGALGTASDLATTGRLRVLPVHYSRFCAAFAEGSMRADVVLLQLAAPRGGRAETWSLSLANDYAAQAARHARLVIAEIREDIPWTCGASLPEGVEPHLLVEADGAPVELAPPRLGSTERRIADHIAGLVPDGACLQFGIGSVAAAALRGLAGHRDLGIHSGVIPDGWADLVEAGAITNARKTNGRGLSVTNTVLGTRRLFPLLDRNPDVEVRPAAFTHDLATIAANSDVRAINSAIEVDLTGRVNAEIAAGRYVGATGGQLDFVRGAAASWGGRSIVALPATARGGSASRVVPAVAAVTTPRSDADLVVTEFGVADLRHASLAERARRMIAVAAPEFRDELTRAWREGEGRHVS